MKNKVVKLAAVFMATAMMVSMFSGCGSTNDAVDTSAAASTVTDTASQTEAAASSTVDLKGTKVTFWNGFTSSDGDILREIFDRYNKTNDKGIEVQMDIMPWANMLEKLGPSIATGTGPSLILLGSDSIPEYSKSGGLVELDDFWATTGLDQSMYEQNVQDAFKYEGKTYGIPQQYNTVYLYWNKDLFQKAGLDPEKPPKTFTELKDYAAKLTDKANNKYGFGIAKESSNVTNFLWSNGGDWLDKDLKNAACNTPEAIEVLTMLQDFAKNGHTPIGMAGADTDNLFTSGQLGMYINGPWLVNGLRTNGVNFGIGAVPGSDSGNLQVPGSGVAFMVTSSAKDNEKLAAYDCIKYWLSKDILKEWTLKNGTPAWSKEVIEDADVQNDEIQKVLGPLTQYGRLAFAGMTEAGQITNDCLNPLFEKLMYNQITPEECAKQMAEGIDKILGK